MHNKMRLLLFAAVVVTSVACGGHSQSASSESTTANTPLNSSPSQKPTSVSTVYDIRGIKLGMTIDQVKAAGQKAGMRYSEFNYVQVPGHAKVPDIRLTDPTVKGRPGGMRDAGTGLIIEVALSPLTGKAMNVNAEDVGGAEDALLKVASEKWGKPQQAPATGPFGGNGIHVFWGDLNLDHAEFNYVEMSTHPVLAVIDPVATKAMYEALKGPTPQKPKI